MDKYLKSKALMNEIGIASRIKERTVEICDFFSLAEKYSLYFKEDISSEFYSTEEASGLYFFTSDRAKELRTKAIEGMENCAKQVDSVVWIDALFDTNGLSFEQSFEFQRINWVLEEIYAELMPHQRFLRVDCGKIQVKSNLEETIKDWYSIKKEYIEEKIDEKVKEEAFIGWFDVNVVSENERLEVEVCLEKPLEDAEYYFYLLRNGEIIDRKGWFKKNTFQWNLESDGIYCVQGFVQTKHDKQYRFSNVVSRYSDLARNRFNEFLSKGPTGSYPYRNELSLHQGKKPFADILIASHDKCEGALRTFSHCHPAYNLELNSYYGNHSVGVLCNGGVKETTEGDFVVFSGTMLSKESVVFGTEDIPEDITVNEIAFKYGNYSGAWLGKESLSIFTDCFSISRWFYYQADGCMVLSNRYHLLLLYLNMIGIKLSFDERKAAMLLSTMKIHALNQNLSRFMDIKEIRQLRNDESLTLTEKGWNLGDSPLGEVLKREETFHENTYRTLLKLGKEEIVKNVQCAVDEKRINNVIVDLSGGLDSRVVYGALTNINHPKLKEKVRILTNTEGFGGDMPIAAELNEKYQFLFDDLPRDISYFPASEADQFMRSAYLGTYMYYNLFNYINNVKYVELKGTGGEIIARPYYARKYLGIPCLKGATAEKFAKFLWSDFAPYFVVADEESRKKFLESITYEFGLTPQLDCLHAYDQLFACYGNGYHTDEEWRYEFLNKGVLPFQSIYTFRAFRMSYERFHDIRVHLDLLALLDSQLLSCVFDSEANNTDYLALRDNLLVQCPAATIAEEKRENGVEHWKAAKEKKEYSRKSENIPRTMMEKNNHELNCQAEAEYQALLVCFREFMIRKPDLQERIGVSFYEFIISHKSEKSQIRFSYNKIRSFLDQMNIIEG